MPELVWTTSERQALVVALQHFGPCKCREREHGHLAYTCDGHSFLSEHDRRVDRLQHLLFVRRTKQAWLDAEFMHMPPPPQGEIVQPVLPEVVRAMVAAPAEAEPPTELPW